MKTTENTIFIDNYYGLLSTLCNEDKMKIMAKLSLSIAENSPKEKNAADSFFGAFQSDKSAEEIIRDIKSNRHFNRVVELL